MYVQQNTPNNMYSKKNHKVSNNISMKEINWWKYDQIIQFCSLFLGRKKHEKKKSCEKNYLPHGFVLKINKINKKAKKKTTKKAKKTTKTK